MKSTKFVYIGTIVVTTTLGLMNAAAEETSEALSGSEAVEGVMLNEITVTAAPLTEDELHIAQPVIVLRGDELLKRQSATIGETLTRELGVSSTSFGLGASRPVIRGLSGSRIKVLESGMGSMDVSNLSDDHAVSIEPAQASQIEVLKGPATLMYGSGAIGGIVNVVTDRIPSQVNTDARGHADFRYNSATNEKSGGASVDVGTGDFAFHLDGRKRTTSDYDIPGFGSINPEPGEQSGILAYSDIYTQNLAGGAAYLGEWGDIGFSVANYRSNYGIPGEGARIDLDQIRYDVKGILYEPLPGFTLAKLRLSHNDYTHQEFEPSGELGTTFTNNAYEGRIELQHAPIWETKGIVGLQVEHRDFAAIGEETLTPPVTGRSVGFFAVEERDWNDWHFELGARYENTLYDAQSYPATSEHNLYSVSGGAIWKFQNDYSAGLSLTRAQRAPSIEELFNNGPHEATQSFERGDPNLQHETANNIDLTLRKSAGSWTWKLNGFANYIEDFIYGQSIDSDQNGLADRLDETGNLTTANDGKILLQFTQHDAIFYGLEFENIVGLMRDKNYGNVDGRLFLDYVDGELTNGDNLPRITPLRFGGSLDYRKGPWLGNLEIMRVNRQTDVAQLETETPGYTLVDLGLTYTLKSKPSTFSLSLRGTNLLDEDIRYHTSLLKDVAPQPGRSVSVNLRVDF